MNKPHKHAELIKAWADGAEIQVRVMAIEPYWRNVPKPNWDDSCIYRIKPKTIRYRNFLWQSALTNALIVSITTTEEDQREPRSRWIGFIKWLGDWQEVEV